MHHPSRGGVRGGTDQFSWEDVKADKYRENYLGHSVKAPIGRWQKGKDLTWYAKGKKDGPPLTKEEELALIKQAEKDAMMAALGHKVVKKQASGLSKQELAEVCHRGTTERDDRDIERKEGMGYGSSRMQTMGVNTTNIKEAEKSGSTVFEHVRREENKRKHSSDDETHREKSKKKKKDKKSKKEKKKRKEKKKKKKYESSSSDTDSPSSSRRRRHNSDSDDNFRRSKHQSKHAAPEMERHTVLKRTRHDSDSSNSGSDAVDHSSRTNHPDRQRYAQRQHNTDKAAETKNMRERERDRRHDSDSEESLDLRRQEKHKLQSSSRDRGRHANDMLDNDRRDFQSYRRSDSHRQHRRRRDSDSSGNEKRSKLYKKKGVS
ncbi:uncharacterized protein LOC100370812 [Saccoglossus kowalevskii]|uniref:Multiple myeloma tumor-associated protein 2-like n=1 Tax=Saccoglossus kowalevskii TaxID=10224 RepID=A0ABM0GSF1_SACKO|nr:PREDICTED: multiple myeloma tumor-associated protein 2-like [Saccoglossus kowalevskii]